MHIRLSVHNLFDNPATVREIKSAYFEVNKIVEIPVYVKVYQKRNDEIAYSFCV